MEDIKDALKPMRDINRVDTTKTPLPLASISSSPDPDSRAGDNFGNHPMMDESNKHKVLQEQGRHVSEERGRRTKWLGTTIVAALLAVAGAYSVKNIRLSAENMKTCYIMISTYVLLTMLKLVKRIGDGKVDAKQIAMKVGLCVLVIFVPFVFYAFIEGHTFVNDVICKQFCPIENKQLGFCASESVLAFVHPKMFNKTFTCPSRKDSNRIISEKIDNATESVMKHITRTCGSSGMTGELEKIQVEINKVRRLEVEKNTAQDFVEIIQHFDLQESYTKCDEERHKVIQQLKHMQSGITLLNQTVQEQRQRMQETSRDSQLSSQLLLFHGGISEGYLRSRYVGTSSTTLSHISTCTHEKKFHEYNDYLQRISDASKDKFNGPLDSLKDAFLVLVKDLLAYDVDHESHEVFRHLKHRVVSDVALFNACNIWISQGSYIELRDDVHGFKDVVCMLG